MAEQIESFEDERLNRQFREILQNLTHKNVNEEDFFILTSPDGTQWRITIDNTGSLSTEEV
jgi:hypothetical protein